MSSENRDTALSGLTLGKPTAYRDRYDATLLQAVPRSLNREPLGLYPDNLPFHGADIWTLYELSWLNGKGLPQVAVGEVGLNADSVNLIESKSFKLYLNSFNQTTFADWDAVRQTLERDLSACANGKVSVALFRLSEVEGQPIAHFAGDCIDEQDITISDYGFNADYLASATGSEVVEETLGQPSAEIQLSDHPSAGLGLGADPLPRPARIDREALLRYLVSFRHHNEFHEQCVERIFNDIQRFCQPAKH